jgi:hypothetical protein
LATVGWEEQVADMALPAVIALLAGLRLKAAVEEVMVVYSALEAGKTTVLLMIHFDRKHQAWELLGRAMVADFLLIFQSVMEEALVEVRHSLVSAARRTTTAGALVLPAVLWVIRSLMPVAVVQAAPITGTGAMVPAMVTAVKAASVTAVPATEALALLL